MFEKILAIVVIGASLTARNHAYAETATNGQAQVALGQAADSGAYKRALEKGKELLQQQKYSEALRQFQQASAADPSQYEPFFNLAVVSYRTGDIKAAEDFAKIALSKADGPARNTVQEMIAFIEGKREFARFLAVADEAFEKGLMSKAADAYRSAFLSFPSQGEIGLKAAELYSARLNRLLDAAVLWQKISRGEDKGSAGMAREKLAERGNALQSLFDAQLQQADRIRASGDPSSLLSLAEAFPQKWEPHFELAVFYAGKADATKTIQHLSAANKAGLQPSVLLEREEFGALLPKSGGAEFQTFLTDAYGADLSAKVRRQYEDREKERAEARRKAEQEQADHERREQTRQADLRRQREAAEVETRAAQARRVAEEKQRKADFELAQLFVGRWLFDGSGVLVKAGFIVRLQENGQLSFEPTGAWKTKHVTMIKDVGIVKNGILHRHQEWKEENGNLKSATLDYTLDPNNRDRMACSWHTVIRQK